MSDVDQDAWIYAAFPGESLLDAVCPEPTDPKPITHTEPAGALVLWRAELRAGVRTFTTCDALATAAQYEQAGLEAKRQGLHHAASKAFKAAERTILEAAARKQQAAA